MSAGWHLEQACRALRHGGVVLHATEGLWGLACDPFDPVAVGVVLELKQRELAKGLILIGADAATFEPELNSLDESDRKTVIADWPGPVTWILPSQRFPAWVTGGRDSVAVRVPGHPQARALCRSFGGALVSTSANRAGLPPARNCFQARAWLSRAGVGVDYLLPGETAGTLGASTIRSIDGMILRQAGG